jgi:3-dehydroquinate synthase
MNDSLDAPFSVEWTHRLRFTEDAFAQAGTIETLLEELSPIKVLAFVDDGLFSSNESFKSSLESWCARTTSLCTAPVILTGGESAKNNSEVVHGVLEEINRNGLCRNSCILVIGGGAILDAVGYVASIAHRGIPLIRMPSTTLSQGDSGVGVKNGINYFGKKNFIGVFDPPYAVVNDCSLLQSLSDEHWRSGLSEAIKVALIKDGGLLQEIENNVEALIDRNLGAMTAVIRRSAELHLLHITQGGDPFERLDARPLDFGHWAAHKLEPMTGYSLSHGDAVAIGLAIDMRCSVILGLLETEIADRVIALLHQLGFPTNHAELQNPELLEGIEEFRQHLGGQLTLLMLKGIEDPIDIHQLDSAIVRQAIDELM